MCGADFPEDARAYPMLDRLVRTCLAGWLEAAGLLDEAGGLRDLRPIRDAETAWAARMVIDQTVDRMPGLSVPGRSEGFVLHGIAGRAAGRVADSVLASAADGLLDGDLRHRVHRLVRDAAFRVALDGIRSGSGRVRDQEITARRARGALASVAATLR